MMAETLGSLCDKLIIVKLKAYHTKRDDRERMEKLSSQDMQLRKEINEYVSDVISGKITIDRLTCETLKIHTGVIALDNLIVSIGGSMATLADVNCDIWHLQEKLYNFEKVPAGLKNIVVRQIAVSNIKRTKCIDDINQQFKELLK
jgi:hypothetical protein